jgi:predicted aminopeptidase
MINKVFPLHFFVAIGVLILIVFASGCSSVAYYSQAIDGQLTILGQREPIANVIADPETPDELRQKLKQVQAMRRFAVSELALPDNPSYTTYVDLKRPYVVWNVFAAPQLSLTPRQWCFPVTGCVSYRGYFKEQNAHQFAQTLRDKGDDVYVAGIAAYSTLGWFHDPLLNTMLTRSETSLAGTLFHELAHQQLFVKGDTTFNESFATAVELEGVRRWLLHHGHGDQYQNYERMHRRKMQFIDLVQITRNKLKKLYADDIPDDAKRKDKQRIFSDLKQDYRNLKVTWGGYRGYDNWFARELNNAHLVPIGSYHDYVPAMQRLLNLQGDDLTAFYREAKRIAGLEPAAREAAISKLTPGKQP